MKSIDTTDGQEGFYIKLKGPGGRVLRHISLDKIGQQDPYFFSTMTGPGFMVLSRLKYDILAMVPIYEDQEHHELTGSYFPLSIEVISWT